MKYIIYILLFLSLPARAQFMMGEAGLIYTNACSNPSAITGTLSACAGATSQLSDATAGGTWTSSSTSVATVGTAGLVTGVAAGTSVISYTVFGGCKATATFTVNAQPAAITGTLTVVAAATTQLSNATAGGIWSSSTTSIATVGTAGLVTGLAAGTSTISYVLTGGCYSLATVTVTGAYTPPTANMVFHYDASVASSVHIATGVATWDNLYTGSSPTPAPAMTQTVTANQPVYSGSGMTSKIAFDGTNDYLRTLFTYNQPVTIYIVMKTVTNRANDVLFDGGISNTLVFQQATYPNVFLNGLNFNLTGLTAGAFQVISLVANSSGTSSMTCQGSSFNNLGGGSPGGATMGGFTVGARVGFFYSIMEVQEIIGYNINHSTTSISLTQSQIISYLRSKWGI